MKYLNLVNKDTTTSEFVAQIPGNMQIGENTKIALEQINLTFAGNSIVIDDTNNSFQFNPYARRANQPINDIGNQRINVKLTNGIYTSLQELVKNIQDSINIAVPLWDNGAGSQNYQGLQWKCYIDATTKKFTFHYVHEAPTIAYQDILTNNINKAKAIGGQTGTFAGKEGGDNLEFDGYLMNRNPLSRSNGYVKYELITSDATAENIVGFTKKGFSTASTLELDDFYFAIYSKPGEANFWIKNNDVEEELLDNAALPIAITTNLTNFAIYWGGSGVFEEVSNIQIDIGAQATDVLEFDGRYHSATPSYFAMSTKENSTYYIGYTGADQNIDYVQDAFQTTDTDHHVVEIAPLRLYQNTIDAYNGNSRYFIFTTTLGELLGFPDSRVIQGLPGDNTFSADKEIKPFISMTGFSPKNLIVQLPNMDIESISSTGKRNIIAVIPNSDRSNYDLSYKVNEKLFINLKNKKPDTLSSLRVVVTDDLGFIFNVVPSTLNVALVLADDSDKI